MIRVIPSDIVGKRRIENKKQVTMKGNSVTIPKLPISKKAGETFIDVAEQFYGSIKKLIYKSKNFINTDTKYIYSKRGSLLEIQGIMFKDSDGTTYLSKAFYKKGSIESRWLYDKETDEIKKKYVYDLKTGKLNQEEIYKENKLINKFIHEYSCSQGIHTVTRLNNSGEKESIAIYNLFTDILMKEIK